LAFSQLTWRESLRDIELALVGHQSKLFHMGLAQPPARSTLADALNHRDWRILSGACASAYQSRRCLYGDESVLDLDATVYALDATTVELCLSLLIGPLFIPSAPPSSCIRLLDLRGAIPAFVYISDAKFNRSVCWFSAR